MTSEILLLDKIIPEHSLPSNVSMSVPSTPRKEGSFYTKMVDFVRRKSTISLELEYFSCDDSTTGEYPDYYADSSSTASELGRDPPVRTFRRKYNTINLGRANSPRLSKSKKRLEIQDSNLNLEKDLLRIQAKFWHLENQKEKIIRDYLEISNKSGYPICSNCKRLLKHRKNHIRKNKYRCSYKTYLQRFTQ